MPFAYAHLLFLVQETEIRYLGKTQNTASSGRKNGERDWVVCARPRLREENGSGFGIMRAGAGASWCMHIIFAQGICERMYICMQFRTRAHTYTYTHTCEHVHEKNGAPILDTHECNA